METDKKKKWKESFKRYMNASKEEKECKDPCLKNGKSDRYCIDCSIEMIGDLLPKK